MILVTGGAYQGKRAFAEALFIERNPDASCQIRVADGENCAAEDLWNADIADHFHEYVRRFGDELPSPEDFAAALYGKAPGLIIVTNELGSGIVPALKEDRELRERTVRICTEIASYCREVYRVICGVGILLKGNGTGSSYEKNNIC